MKHLSWKYIAGLVDGEGCIDFQPHHGVRRQDGTKLVYAKPRLRIGMSASATDVLSNLKANHGGNLSVRKSTNPNWQDAVTWQLQGRALRPFLQNIVNHLILKREQAKFLLWFQDNVGGKMIWHHPAIGDLRRFANDELKAMKLDPQRLSERAQNSLSALL